MSGARNPAAFGRGGTLALIVAGFVTFIFLLAWIGMGETPGNDGGSHALGKGLTGYAGLAALIAAEGHDVGYNRLPHNHGGDELLVLTPTEDPDIQALADIVKARRSGVGPTIVVTPKWRTERLTSDSRAPQGPVDKAWARVFGAPRAPTGWTRIVGAATPDWKGFLDKIGVHLGTAKDPAAKGWHTGEGASGPLPDDHVVLSGGGVDDRGHPLIPLIRSGDGRILAGYIADGGTYPALDALAGVEPTSNDDDEADVRQPLVIVFEPDLLNNRGLADRATALSALRLVQVTGGKRVQRVVFDLAQAGLGAPRNLLTLAFTPPFLAATLGLIAAMAAAIWRGFVRFGPALAGAPAHVVGKIALVASGAALLLRARRYHLIARPYADGARERLQSALGLPRGRASAETDAAIEQIQRAAAPATMPFGEAVARLIAARHPLAIAAAARQVHQIETALAHRGPTGES